MNELIKAINILDYAAATAKLTRSKHQECRDAANTLRKYFKPELAEFIKNGTDFKS